MGNLDDPGALARLHATLEHFGDAHRSEVLERLAITEEELREGEKRFAAAQVKPRATRDRALSLAYAKEHAATARGLSEARPALESLGPRPTASARPADARATRAAPSVPVADRSAASVKLPVAPMRVDAAPPQAGDVRAPDPTPLPSYLRAAVQREATPNVPIRIEPRDGAHIASSPDSTAELRRPVLSVEPLPFREPGPEDIRRVRAEMDSVPAPPAWSTGTDELPDFDLTEDPDSPEVRTGSGACVTIEQYAMILAQVGINSAEENRAWARFGIFDEADRREVERLFRAAFDRRPGARAHLGELVRIHRRRLVRG